MRSFLILLLATAPIAAFAQYSNAPMIVVGQQGAPVAAPANPSEPTAAPAAIAPSQAFTPDFPEWAVTKAGENSSGGNPVPAAPANTNQAPQAGQAPAPNSAAAPAAPAAPAGPADKLWPIDTLPIFMRSCVGFHIELVAGCKCTIVNLMTQMPHDEFLRLSADGSIENDKRLIAIRYKCIGTPGQKE